MAPSKHADHAIDSDLKEELFSGVQFNGKVPESFVPLTEVSIGLSGRVNFQFNLKNQKIKILFLRLRTTWNQHFLKKKL